MDVEEIESTVEQFYWGARMNPCEPPPCILDLVRAHPKILSVDCMP